MEPHGRQWAQEWMQRPKQVYIDGAWARASGPQAPANLNPANGAQLASITEASPADVARAVRAARTAFAGGAWPRFTRRERARLLQRVAAIVRAHRAELATLIALENGKLYREAYDDDMPDTADVFDYYAGWTDKLYGETCPVDGPFLNYTLREPLGACALSVA